VFIFVKHGLQCLICVTLPKNLICWHIPSAYMHFTWRFRVRPGRCARTEFSRLSNDQKI